MGHANGFWWKNRACSVSQPNLCPGSWQLTRSSRASKSALNWTELKSKMAVIPHPTYSPVLAPCDFFLLPKIQNWSWKDAGLIPLRRYRPNRKECLTLWQKRTSRQRSKNGEDGGTGVCMREGTTLRVTTADRPYGKFYDFYSVSPENFW